MSVTCTQHNVFVFSHRALHEPLRRIQIDAHFTGYNQVGALESLIGPTGFSIADNMQ